MATTRSTPSTTFRDLALALTDEERRELLRKIRQSLSLRTADEESVYSRRIPDSERQGIIAREIAELGLWRRIRLFLRKVFGTRTGRDAFVDFRLSEIRRRIRRGCGELGAVELHSVGAEVARVSWEVYRAAYALIPVFLDFWRGTDYLQDSIEYLLSQRIPAARTNLLDLVTAEEMQDAFMENELKSDVRKLVVERLGTYLDDIPDDLFGHLEEGILPLYYLRPLGLLDFNRFFSVFGFDPGVVPPEEPPPFKDAPTSAALPVMEGMFYALHSANRLEKGFYIHTDIIDRYLELKERQEPVDPSRAEDATRGPEVLPESGGPENEGLVAAEPAPADDAEEESYQRRRIHVQQIREQIEQLHAAAARLSREITFSDLLRFYRRDPWYRMVAYLPRLRLRDFHQSFLRMRVLSQLDQSFGEVRIGVVKRMTEELFGGTPPPFEYYRPAVLSAPDRLGLPRFGHVRSANILYNFLRHLYRGRMQEVVRILSRVLPVRQREASSDLVVHVAGIEEALADLEDFDQSFAPDSDDGKAFYRVRYGVEKDITLHRSYRNLVQQKDREVKGIVDAGLEHLRGLRRVLGNLQRALSDQLRQRYAEADTKVNAVDGLDGLIDLFSERIEILDRLMKQTLAMEEGY